MPSDHLLSPLPAQSPPAQSPPPQPHRALLRILDLDVEPNTLFLDRPVLHIGRARDTCNLVLTGPGIIAHHCSLRRDGERWLLRDRGSTTGTHVNNRRCREPTVLHDGDRISLGLHLLEFRAAPSLALPHILTRLRDAAIDHQFSLDVPSCAPAPAISRTRHSGLLRPAALAAAAALALTLGVAANIAAAPSAPSAPPTPLPAASRFAAPISSHMSHETSTKIAPAAPDQQVTAPAAPDERAEYLAEPPAFELPADALGRGRPDAGALVHALALPPSPDYT
ncbi:MAG: FHA domain-containing protein, partial [Nannocystis sp.]